MGDCSNCAKEKAASSAKENDVKKVAPVPYIAHESDMARQERTIFRLCIALIICAILISACVGICFKLNKNCIEKIESINNAWLDYISQYDFEDYNVDVSTDGGGDANYIGSNGDIYNGTSDGSQTDTETEGR